MKGQDSKISKFFSYTLRHKPDNIGITLDNNGWVPIDEFLIALKKYGKNISREDLDRVVANNNKKRFAISNDGLKIRASQGHSVNVDLGYKPSIPPILLYHGTVKKFMKSIFKKGLDKGNRHHVHLSKDKNTAENVGSRRGKPIILRVDAKLMLADGYKFFISDNEVWLTEYVPPQYLYTDT